MAKAKKKNVRRPWSEKEVATLRKMAPTRPAVLIASALGRTEAALRFKAHMEGISFGTARRKKKAARKK